MSRNEDLGRYLSFQLENNFPIQLGKMSMTELNRDPDNRSTLNKLLEEISKEYGTPINELKRKVSFKLYKSKASNAAFSSSKTSSLTINSTEMDTAYTKTLCIESERDIISAQPKTDKTYRPKSEIRNNPGYSEFKKLINKNINRSLNNKLKSKKRR